MRLKPVIRMSCLLGVLVLCRAVAADGKPALMGTTRDDVLSRLGAPSGDIVAGDREVLVFSSERVVLRAGRVVEVEDILAEPASPPAAAPAVTAGQGNAAVAPSPAADVAAGNTAATAAAPSASTNGQSQSTPTVATSVEPQVVIKSVRPPSADVDRTGPDGASPTTVPETANVPPAAPAPKPAAPAVTTTSTGAMSSAATPASTTPSAASTTPSVAKSAPRAAAAPAAASTPAVSQRTTPAAPARERQAARAEPAAPPPSEGMFTGRTYLIALVIIIGGIVFLLWRRRNRQLLLAATAVSDPAFPARPILSASARFTQELLGQLEWKRFEELVVAYYNKTGVMATRMKNGPAAPVHVRIFWKGEQRPFALVQCIARPAGLIDAPPVQALCEVLAAEDIRRGYIVTPGKFGIAARDLAEEKHVTLLSGDIFLEKLNALPDPVRAELMQEIARGDYTTPTCPRCDVKMVHPAGAPDGWQCPQCEAVLPGSTA